MGPKRYKITTIVMLSAFLFLQTSVAIAENEPSADLHLGIKALIKKCEDIGRLGLQEVKSSDAQTTQRLELELLQILTEEGFDVLTPNKVKQQLVAAQSNGQMLESKHLWAVHLLLGEATTTGDRILVALRIINVSSGQTVAQIQSFAGNAIQKSSLAANTMRGAVERLTDGLHFEIGQLPGATRYQRVAVMPLQENGAAAQNLTLGTYLQQEISGSLVERGYLSVERTRLNEAIAQMGLAQALDADHAPATGKMQVVVNKHPTIPSLRQTLQRLRNGSNGFHKQRVFPRQPLDKHKLLPTFRQTVTKLAPD